MSVQTHTAPAMQFGEPRRLSLCMATTRELASKGYVNLRILQSGTACIFVLINIALHVLATRDTSFIARPSMVVVLVCIAWVINVCNHFYRTPWW